MSEDIERYNTGTAHAIWRERARAASANTVFDGKVTRLESATGIPREDAALLVFLRVGFLAGRLGGPNDERRFFDRRDEPDGESEPAE